MFHIDCSSYHCELSVVVDGYKESRVEGKKKKKRKR